MDISLRAPGSTVLKETSALKVRAKLPLILVARHHTVTKSGLDIKHMTTSRLQKSSVVSREMLQREQIHHLRCPPRQIPIRITKPDS
jgi:hypothetical protein